MNKWIRRTLFACVLSVVVWTILSDQSRTSSGQEQNFPQNNRRPACSCFCGDGTFNTFNLYTSDEIKAGKCWGGPLPADVCLTRLPESERRAICNKVKTDPAFKSLSKCPALAACGALENPPPKTDCEKPTPWFGSSTGCKDVQSPQVTVKEGMVTLSICGYPLYNYNHLNSAGQPDNAFAEDFKSDLMNHVQSRTGSRICCDTFRQAMNSGRPCDPRIDVDCDGKPNNSDQTPFRGVSVSVPDINFFATAEGASIDPFPPGLDPDDTEFFPPQEKCDCKWELVKGTLTCSPDGKQPHSYQARWRCPSTGNERFTLKKAPPTAPCK